MNKYKDLNTICAIYLSLLCTTAYPNQDTKSTYYKNVFVGISFDRNHFSSSFCENIDSGYYIFDYNSYKVQGGSVMAGKRWKYLGLQLGYSFIPSTRSNSYSTNITFKYNNKFADALFFYPINELCDFKSLLGIGLIHSEVNGRAFYIYTEDTKYFKLSKDQLGARLGFGVEYRIGDNVNLDMMAKYQEVNLLYSNDIIFSVGMYYHLC